LLRDIISVKPTTNGENDLEMPPSLEWFSSKKRALLAPFGVGTVDQAELGALNVSHNALRLVGLAGKVLVLDEVHAYDVYMSTILARLLQWLSALGTSVVLLSATLPASRRELLMKSFGTIQPTTLFPMDSYPMIYAGNGETAFVDNPPAMQPDREIALSHLHLEGDCAEEKARWLVSQVEDRGCWCWITNTVRRAQEIFKALKEIAPPDVTCILIHSRFSFADREKLEKQLIDCFGPHGQRPIKAVVIGTQVLEQSLDLDFDGMVSDLAPIDLLLQRAGRLHRHLWRKASERGHHISPHLHIYEHRSKDGKLDISSDKAVYAEYFLRKTGQVLFGRVSFSLPADYRNLVNSVYEAPPPDASNELYDAWKKLKKSESVDSQEALWRLLPEPDPDEPFCSGLTDVSFKEDEDKSGWMVARTRLGEESVTVIPLQRQNKQAICAGLTQPVPLDLPAAMDIQLILLRHGLKISGNGLCAAVRNAAGSRGRLFEKSTLLRNVYPLWLENFQTNLTVNGRPCQIRLDSRLGLIIDRQKGDKYDGIG
jgi:CRISPR-associated endonuclease/helicase Cas3